jgi:Family of unknown function (DUF6152)
MRTRSLACLIAATAALSAGTAAHAHHGSAAYTKDVVTMQAKITEFRFVNPHVQVFFDITNAAGETEHWQGELTAPNKLARAGWTKSTLQPNEECEISGLAARNEGHSLWITKLIKADGTQLPLRETID